MSTTIITASEVNAFRKSKGLEPLSINDMIGKTLTEVLS